MVRLTVAAAVLSLAAAIVAGSSHASPFWYNDSAPATNRVASSSDSAESVAATEFRVLSVVEADVEPFDTRPYGAVLIIR